jgi:hypothetical protein
MDIFLIRETAKSATEVKICSYFNSLLNYNEFS